MRRPRPVWLVPCLVLLVAGGLIATAVFSGEDGGTNRPAAARTNSPSSGTGTPPPGPASDVVGAQTASTDLARRSPNDPLALGPVDAPVVMVVYADYQCPYCAMWSHDTLPAMRKYVRQGTLRIEWRELTIFGPASTRAAKAAYAAGLQGEFWTYHKALYKGGEHRSADELSTSALIDLAVSLGLDRDRFRADYASMKVRQAVQRDVQEGVELGVMATPSFLINGEPIAGAQPTQVFVKMIESALKDQ